MRAGAADAGAHDEQLSLTRREDRSREQLVDRGGRGTKALVPAAAEHHVGVSARLKRVLASGEERQPVVGEIPDGIGYPGDVDVGQKVEIVAAWIGQLSQRGRA